MSEDDDPDLAAPPQNLALVTFGTMLATVMQALDTTIANVALPHMQGSFSATLDQIAWVLTSYIVAAAIMTPPTGWLAARFGRKRLYLTSVAGFTIASVLCGAAITLPQMVIFRLLQGVFGAALVPLSQATLLDGYPREKHGYAMAIWGIGIMAGPILGPTLGGWLTENYNWRWVFYINVPVGALAFFIISAFVPETRRNRGLGFDVFGFVAISLAIGCLQMFLDRGELKDWFGSTEIVVEAALCGLFLYIFLVHTFMAERPFISPSLFADRNFSVSLLVIFVIGAILYSTLALMPPFLQNLLDYPVVTTGFVIAPRGIGTMIAMILVGRIIGPVDARLLLAIGFALAAVSLYWMASFSLDVGIRDIVMSGLVQGIGLGFIWVPVTAIAFSTLDPSRRTEAAGIFNLMRNIGASAGISIVTALLDRSTQVNHEQIGSVITPYNLLLRSPEIERVWDIHNQFKAAALDAEITRQAAMIGYINDYKMMTVLAIVSIPLVLLLTNPRQKEMPKEAPAAIE
ncbi:MAG TPA: DHA2 family efflux MFS transporter permease subunit [Alphaproteobacteria bacterium]|nr:DHA2 family efflux MFS transporter permease subunit [Alphaproteobacteria bacterium]